MEAFGGKDNRKHKRANITAEVVYKYADILDYGGDLKTQKSGRSLDISVSGIQMVVDEAMFPGQVIKMDIHLPHEEVPLTTFGRVEWCRKDEAVIGIYRVGVNFMLIDADHTSLIRKITGE
jgi:c-di-GMP-binding flagellar brake protein YcgR